MTEIEALEAGQRAASLIWEDSPEAAAIPDPRIGAFATGVLDGFSVALRQAPGLMRKLVRHASAAAEDLNVEAFHGVIEVLQNADDLGATEVRIAILEAQDRRRLLIAHNGAPVTCHHVLAMVLPYLTTKSEDAEQKGRFGIGLKTLRRISSRMEVHCAPYHFSAEGMGLATVKPMRAIDEVYDAATDTLLALDLMPDFDPEELRNWFAGFNEENLLFLNSLSKLSWIGGPDGDKISHAVQRGAWTHPGDGSDSLEVRQVAGTSAAWTVHRAEVECPDSLGRSHKATGATTKISVAVADNEHPSGIFISFRTRLPVTLPFSIDAQFDPSTAREGLIDNPWNRWLIARCGDVVQSIAAGLLATDAARAWDWIPLGSEHVGVADDPWPGRAFDEAFSKLRLALAETGMVRLGEDLAPISDLCFESEELEGLLGASDLERLFPERQPVPDGIRDAVGRWRAVLASIGVSKCAGIEELLDGFRRAVFSDHPVGWWVEAAARLTHHATPAAVLGTPCWLSDAGHAVSALPRGSTERPLVIGPELSAFGRRWSLFDRLHQAYSSEPRGQEVVAWLQRNAEVTAHIDEAAELAAFAEAYHENPIVPMDAELREIRDRFDQLSDRSAAPLGPKVGKALLLDAYSHRGGKKVTRQAAATEAYLPRTLDGEYPFWPEAAGSTPDLIWLSPSYDERLKTAARGRSRRLDDGTVSRGPRKFLMLLGAACWPRVHRVGRIDGGGPSRQRALRAAGAEFVEEDYSSPDLRRVLSAIARANRKERRSRSAALMKALSRYWPIYSDVMVTTAWHMALKYQYPRGAIDAEWLCHLRDAEWVVLNSGKSCRPDEAVIRTVQTQAAYAAGSFVANIAADDLDPAFTGALRLITDVRASDLVAAVEAVRAEPGPPDIDRALQAYRALAKQCPPNPGWNSKVGDLSLHDLKQRFGAGSGLIVVPLADTEGLAWRKPADLLVGRDVIHQPERFAPGGASCARLWAALGIQPPKLGDCISALRRLAASPLGPETDATLIDIYRYMEPLVSKADRRERMALRSLPVSTGRGWTATRPVFHVEDRELRFRLAAARPDLSFWSPPCDVHSLPQLVAALGLTVIEPTLRMVEDGRARETGETMRLRFQACVDHLSNELARNDPAAREQIRMSWPELRQLPLSVSDGPFRVLIEHPSLSLRPIAVEMEAALTSDPPHLFISANAFPQRDRGGRAIAKLFPPDVRHRVEAEWVASWVASADGAVAAMTLASDEELAQALAEQASKIEVKPGSKIAVSAPASRSKKAAMPRQLKSGHGGVVSVEVVTGSPPTPAGPKKPLAKNAPPPSPPPPDPSTGAPLDYDARDLEQHAWEVLAEILNSSEEAQIADFRKRHQVGADGAIDWKKFVELKATGGAPQASIELSATEFERAQEKGIDYVLALVSGLEKGRQTEIRLIFDPANRVSLRPSGSVRLVGLADAPAVVVRLADEAAEQTIAA
jgi:hypothetical protein